MGTLGSSRHLYNIAWNYYKKALEIEQNGNKYPEESLISIVFAHSYMEGFLNDFIEICCVFPIERFYLLRSTIKEIKNVPLFKKYRIAYIFLNRELVKKKNYLPKDFKLLCNLRNNIVHLKPTKVDIHKGTMKLKIPNLMKKLDGRNIISLSEEENTTWFLIIRKAKVAKWACETAIETTNSLIDVIPEEEIKKHLKIIFKINLN